MGLDKNKEHLDVVVGDIAPGDIPEGWIQRFAHETSGGIWDRGAEIVRGAFWQGGLVAVATARRYRNGNLGTTDIEGEPNALDITGCFVPHRSFRRGGIGSAMLDSFLRTAEEEDLGLVTMECTLQGGSLMEKSMLRWERQGRGHKKPTIREEGLTPVKRFRLQNTS